MSRWRDLGQEEFDAWWHDELPADQFGPSLPSRVAIWAGLAVVALALLWVIS